MIRARGPLMMLMRTRRRGKRKMRTARHSAAAFALARLRRSRLGTLRPVRASEQAGAFLREGGGPAGSAVVVVGPDCSDAVRHG